MADLSVLFLSTPSARRATSITSFRPSPIMDFYPRPPRGGRRGKRHKPSVAKFISIHALREEGDRNAAHSRKQLRISIHALREEGDKRLRGLHLREVEFLSTPSARRATRYQRHRFQLGNISIHALREEGDAVRGSGWCYQSISIHALREEGDIPRRRRDAG